MTNKIKKLLIATFVTSFLSLSLIPATINAAAIQQAACQGSNLTFDNATQPDSDACAYEGQTNDGPGRINNLINDVINVFSVVVGIVAVIMIIYGGFRYITSGGDSSKITDAKNTIIYAIVGLVIVVFAQFIVKFVLSKITNNGSG